MKTIHNILFILLVSLVLQGCVPGSSGTNSKAKTTSKSTTPTSPTFTTDENLYWFTSAKVTGALTVNLDTSSVVYLRGALIHNFLAYVDTNKVANYQKQFCLVGEFGSAFRQLRARAVPMTVTASNKAIERVLRVDLPSTEENTATCAFTTINTMNPATTVPDKTVAFSVPDLCYTSGCLGALATSTSLTLYLNSSNVLSSQNVLPVANALKVDLQSNTTTPGTSCTHSACTAKGFDCCSDGQCVMDASIKSNASANADYAQAMSEYNANPLSFINFPNIFNICSNIAHTPPAIDPGGTTPLTDAQKRVAAYLEDYKCIDQVQTLGTYSLCLPGGAVSDYNTVKKKLTIACGCPATYSDSEIIAKCPDWGVRPLYSSALQTISNIVDFYCHTPTPDNQTGTITNLNVTVPNKSAPHRFYSTAGTNYDEPSKQASTVIQEGDDFYYLDDVNKMSPVNNKYNMNSVLGRMNVAMTHTQPAKMVNVELGSTYILTATSGYFTPCSQCAKDSWFQTFSAHPSTSGGLGLRASGFSTSRDTYAANATYGNYEDTHFGRACFIPPTMIPFSHKKDISLQTQRLNRLKTQAAFYINGYQKDWYGFNKGALIGSFNGVDWFAIGQGRRVTATSKKLFLAINGAFLDIVSRTDTVVNIIPDNSASVVADYDYDPTLSFTDIKQNSAGSCQQYHQCSTDTDCVTQLGWEYACAEVGQMRSKWPIYDGEAKEIANQEKSGNIFENLLGTTTIGNSSKRCVYRGAGSPCLMDFKNLDGKPNQKALTCAPNFYCAALDSNRFNDEVARSANDFDNILYGMDTNVLGRPLKYVTASKTLSTEVISNIRNSAAVGSLSIDAANMGICRPGRALSASQETSHKTADNSKRTDYISQIASCDSTSTGDTRSATCPAFGDDLDYLPYNTVAATLTNYKKSQNACGGEAKNSISDFASAFKNIEAGSLQILTQISSPTLVADACFRRPGAVCHTDLDCAPNKMHAEIANSLPLNFFGGTDAEQSYWEESLICGQGAAIPSAGSSNYATYKLNENRCCREVGKDFTMFTTGPATLVPENMGTNVNLDTKKFASTDPKASGRYSRYAVSKTAISTPAAIPTVAANTIPAANQWKVVNETASSTCCGGGWIRKFADGTHDWKIKNRLQLEAENLSCLNFRSPLASSSFSNFTKTPQETYQREYEAFCRLPGQQGCMQILWKSINLTSIFPPTVYDPAAIDNVGADDGPAPTPPAWATSAPYGAAYSRLPLTGRTRLDTGFVGDIESGNYTFRTNPDVPYQPFPYTFSPYPYDLTPMGDGSKKSLAFFTSKLTDYGVSMYLPAYIPYNGTPLFSRVYIKYYYENGSEVVTDITAQQGTDPQCAAILAYSSPTGQPVDAFGAGDNSRWCVISNASTQNRPIMNVKAFTGATTAANPGDWIYASIIIDFAPLEKQNGLVVTDPGSPNYYESKLARLELLGIPQITYEPLYCNSDQSLLVPGIFTSSIQTRAQFVANSFVGYDSAQSYTGDDTNTSESAVVTTVGNYQNRMTYQDKLGHQAVFSSKDFACCTPLGKETVSAAKCCSGAASTTGAKMTCKLPTGTDLNVYFNKFVSNEGVGDNEPGGGLVISGTDAEIDFNAYTGEPKIRNSTMQKLLELGKSYCQTGVVRNGGIFGQFMPEPYSGYDSINGSSNLPYPISILDSPLDTDSNFGKFAFDSGYRWYNHYYCQ